MTLPDTLGSAGPPEDPDDHPQVTLPSGASFDVLTEGEADYVAQRVDRYQSAYRISDMSDLQDMDRVIIFELLTQRWSQWLALGEDYEHGPIDEATIRKNLQDYSRELRLLKKQLGMDKLARERSKGEGSVAHYLSNLLVRAKQQGYHRNEQAAQAIEREMELIGLITHSRNCSPEERIEFHVTNDDIVEWIWSIWKPEVEALDADYRTRQATWIRDM